MSNFSNFFLTFFMFFFITNSAYSENYELALNWKAEPEFGGFYASIEILKKEGISLKVTEGGSGTPTIQMLASKKIPLAIVSSDELITARDRGMDLIALFAVYQTNPQGIMVRESSPWKTLPDLLSDSKAILAVQLGLPYVAYLKNKFPNIKAKLVPYQGGIGPFLAQENYAQQCFITAEPLTAEKSGIKARTFTLDSIGFNPYLAVVAVDRKSYLAKKNDFDKIISGFRRGWENYLKQPQDVDQLMNKLNPSMTMETFTASGKAQIKLVKPTSEFIIGSMDKERWKILSLQLQELKLIKKAQPPENYAIFN